MKEIDGACEACHEAMEAYIGGELPQREADEVASHLAACDACRSACDERRDLIAALREVPGSLGTPRPVHAPSDPARARAGARAVAGWRLVAAAAAALAVLSVSALTVPAFAEKIPGLPVARRLERLEAERDSLRKQAESLSDRVEELEIEIKNIGGEKVPVVDSAGEGAVSPEVNDAVQRLGMEFIRAQYQGDAEALKSMATARLRAEIGKHPGDYLKKPGEVVFAQMTTVAKTADGTLLLFVRLSDAEFSDSTYQEDFEIKFENGKYLVDSVGMDA